MKEKIWNYVVKIEVFNKPEYIVAHFCYGLSFLFT